MPTSRDGCAWGIRAAVGGESFAEIFSWQLPGAGDSLPLQVRHDSSFDLQDLSTADRPFELPARPGHSHVLGRLRSAAGPLGDGARARANLLSAGQWDAPAVVAHVSGGLRATGGADLHLYWSIVPIADAVTCLRIQRRGLTGENTGGKAKGYAGLPFEPESLQP